jgi:MFS family permease
MWLFPMAGLLGFWAYYRYSLIEVRGAGMPQLERKFSLPFADFVRVLARDRRFLAYELFFTIYGIGFFVTLPLFYLLCHDELKMTYDQFAGSYMVIPQVIMLVLTPIYGRLMDRINPLRLCAVAFGFLSLWPLTLGFTTRVWHAYGAFAFYSLGMAAVNVTWTLGSLFFAPEREAQKYHSVHVTFVGLRAAVGPWLATLVLKPLLGLRPSFFVAFALFAISAGLMLMLHIRVRRARPATVLLHAQPPPPPAAKS